MPSVASALPVSPWGGLGYSPGGTCRATCPRHRHPAAVADSAASFGGPVAEPKLPAVSAFPFKGSFARPVPWNPVSGTLSYLPSLGLRLEERVGTLVAPAASVPSRGKLIPGLELGTHPSTVSWLGSGWG